MKIKQGKVVKSFIESRHTIEASYNCIIRKMCSYRGHIWVLTMEHLKIQNSYHGSFDVIGQGRSTDKVLGIHHFKIPSDILNV